MHFQQLVIRNTIFKEDLFIEWALKTKSAKYDKPIIVICDRGAKDGESYVGADIYSAVLKEENLDREAICAGRYEKIIVLRTAADGKEQYYTTENNETRTETPARARELCHLTEKAWHGHPNLKIVDNSTDFEGKMIRVQHEIASLLGIPTPTEFERKFLLKTHADEIAIPVPFTDVFIKQCYLDRDRERIRVRTSSGSNSSTYFHTFKENHPSAERVKLDRIIDRDRYNDLLSRRDPKRGMIKKTRSHFSWENQYFELDHFDHNGMWILEVRSTQEQREIVLPPFIPDSIEVTSNPNYYNYNIALETLDC